jgi:hypothetical protein
MVGGRRQMAEAIAWWKPQLPNGREALSDAAVDLLVAGGDGPAVQEIASSYSDEYGANIDSMVDRLIVELDLSSALAEGDEVIATRRMCRLVLADAMAERELSRWAHAQFHHQSDDELLNDLALLDDDYDDADDRQAETGELRRRIRDIARRILAKQPTRS